MVIAGDGGIKNVLKENLVKKIVILKNIFLTTGI